MLAPDFKSLFEALPGLYLVLLPDFTIVAVSDAYLKATMTERESILGCGLFEIFPDNPNDQEADGVLNLRGSLNLVIVHKVPHTMAVQKYDIRRPDGIFEVRYWSPLNTPVLNPQNELVYIIHNVTDVTFRQTAEERLKKSEKDYQLLVSSVKDYAIFMVDTNGYVASWNSGAENIKGYTAQEIIGKHISVFYTAEELETREPDRNLQMALQHGHFEAEGWRLRKNGSRFYADIVFTALIDEDGSFYGYAKVTRDITDRKKAEDALGKLNEQLEQRIKERTAEIEKNEKRFRALVENNYDMISLMDESFKIIYRSPSAYRITGWTDEDLQSADGTKNIHPDDLGKARDDVRELMDNPGKVIDVLFRNRHKDGHYLWVEGTIINLLQDKDVKAIVFNFRDITQRKEMEALLHKANDLARIGGWEIDLARETVYWSDITKEIHETDQSYVPDLATGINFYKEGNGRNLIIQKVKEAIDFGKPWDLELQIITAKNNERWIRTIGGTEFVNGKCVRIYGSFQDIDQRKKAEEKLVKERTLLRTLIDNIPDYIYVKDLQSRHLINNKANVELLGVLTEKETIGKSVNDFLNPEIASAYMEDDQLVFQSGEPVINKEETIIAPTGETKYLLTTKIPLLDDDNSVIGLVGISRDITLQKQIELDLREKKYFLEKAQQVGQIGYWISGIGSTAKLTWSDETCRIFGVKPGSFDGQLKTFFNFIHPEDIDRLTTATSYAIANNLTYRIEHRIILLNGDTRWVYEQGEATYDSNGKALLIIGIVQDITERKEKEERLIENEKIIRLAETNYREIFDKASDAIYVHEIETGKVIEVNQRAAELTGFSKEETINSNPGVFITDDPQYSLQHASAYLQQAAAGKPQRFDWLSRKKDGSYNWLEVNLKKATIAGKERILAFFRDVNDRKRVQLEIQKLNEGLEQKVINRTEQLKKTNEELESFSYSVSHDLRAPLRSILGFTNILEEDYSSKLDDEAKRITAIIKNSALKMGNLIDDLLAFSRTGRQDLNKTKINTVLLVNEVINEQVQHAAKTAAISFDIGELPDAYGDINMIRQVWINLISNAIKYSSHKAIRHIEIKSFAKEGQAVFFVKDNGAGFDEKYADKLFKVFQRLHNSGDFEGTGVGLALVEKIITRHGGKVWAEGKENIGACFYFSVPATSE